MDRPLSALAAVRATAVCTQRARGALTIGELLAELSSRGLVVGGRDPRKTLSDFLRYEVRLGRVERAGRGRFVARPRPRTIDQWHRTRLTDLEDEARRRQFRDEHRGSF